MICKKCGYEYNIGNFCPKCGTLKKDETVIMEEKHLEENQLEVKQEENHTDESKIVEKEPSLTITTVPKKSRRKITPFFYPVVITASCLLLLTIYAGYLEHQDNYIAKWKCNVYDSNTKDISTNEYNMFYFTLDQKSKFKLENIKNPNQMTHQGTYEITKKNSQDIKENYEIKLTSFYSIERGKVITESRSSEYIFKIKNNKKIAYLGNNNELYLCIKDDYYDEYIKSKSKQ